MSLMKAEKAHERAEWARKPVNVWDKVFDRIGEEADNGRFMLVFDEEKENVRFKEHRKEVKQKLEELGYSVSYRRVRDDDDWCGVAYHNCYTIEW